MRKIELEMLEAIGAKKDWSKDNTRVEYNSSDTPKLEFSKVFLHNNHIGDYWYLGEKFEPNEKTFKEWPTRTTASRLRALGVAANIQKGEACINYKDI